ncbi:MAG: hypothetical protein IT320_01305 [Anaerolineae bacterium]|nr:hypothetical protein [Anaerolineae bacterium]
MMNSQFLPTEPLLAEYFENKAAQLLSGSKMAVTQHSGLKGSHREQLIRVYLQDIVPKRYEISRGMIYGMIQRSHECDVVVWDSANYPCIRLADHTMFFAESVRAVFEVKSKCDAIHKIIKKPELMGLADQIRHLQLEIMSMQLGTEHDGILIAPNRIFTAAVFFRGGESFSDIEFSDDELQIVDDMYPDLMLFLEPGIVVRKVYEGMPTEPIESHLEIVQGEKYSLLLFTSYWLQALITNSVQVEDPLFLDSYIPGIIESLKIKCVDFPSLRFCPGARPLWK